MNTQNKQRSRFGLLSKLGIAIAAVAGLIALTMPTYAQTGEPPIMATVDRTQLSTDDTLLLTIKITTNGTQYVQPVIPGMDDFTVVGQSSSTQSTIINGVGSFRVIYELRLQPRQAGTLTIPTVSITLDGVTHGTAPITIEAAQGTGQSNLPDQPITPPTELNGQDFYVEAEVDKTTPYMGEQLDYIFRFYYAEGPSQSPNYGPPQFTGFWSDYEPQQTNYSTTVAGRNYRVAELRTALFPALSGELTLEPTTLDIPGGFFSRGQRLETLPVTVTVQPLPDGAPASFNGAVGRFEMLGNVDLTETRVDEPVTMQVAIRGTGNVGLMGDPTWEPGDGWRAFEPQSTTNSALTNGVVGGQRTVEQTLIPTQPGELMLPPVEFSYFDPESAEYQTLTTDSVTILVTGDAELPAIIGTDSVNETPFSADSIRSIDPNATELQAATQPLSKSALFAVALAVPVVALGAQAGLQARDQYLNKNSAAYRSKHAAKQAQRTLAAAGKVGGDTAAASTHALSAYLAAKLGQPVAGMTQDGLGTALAMKGISAETIKQAKQLISKSEAGRYAPQTTDNGPQSGSQLLQETRATIDTLENEWS
ncbi:MAG: BatD family protein [Anaerolineae bacterium]|nr:BatD family protein [Anaerolineae bacterium]MCO5196358.1 BatD family protein [Anaerolineae bacterium]